MQKIINVACGIVCHQGKVLVTQRGPHKSNPLLWEFPGGKMEAGESVEKCLHRELLEELGIRVKIISSLSVTEYDYGDFSIRLHPLVGDFAGGNIRLSDHLNYVWATPESLTGFDWTPADIPVVTRFLKQIETHR